MAELKVCNANHNGRLRPNESKAEQRIDLSQPTDTSARSEEGNSEDVSDEENRTWRHIGYIYGTEEATLQGIRYIVEPSFPIVRRLAWLAIFLTACGLFIYVTYTQVYKLIRNEKSINIDSKYVSSVPFPAVTICNANPYRISAMADSDLYDLLVVDESYASTGSGSSSVSADEENYLLYTDICLIPEEIYEHVNIHRIVSVSRAVCRDVCSHAYTDDCSGFLYNTTDRSCTLSPYTGQWRSLLAQSCSRSNSTKLEFYGRVRTLGTLPIICTFENNDNCTFVNGATGMKTERWTYSQSLADTHDNTVDQDGKGHYMNIITTNVRAGYKARYVTPYINTTGQCLEMFYWIKKLETDAGTAARANVAKLEILQIYEELTEESLTVTDVKNTDYARLFVRLKPGVHRIAIDGIRDALPFFSGISIDDIVIMDCKQFDAEKECLTNPAGRGYMGTKNVSSSGRPCLPWTEAPAQVAAFLPDSTTLDAHNYCRYVTGQGWLRPRCLVKVFNGMGKDFDDCDIKYCGDVVGCRQNKSVVCKNKMCLPSTLPRDGTDYCRDGRTTTSIFRNTTDVSCNFLDSFMCGYTSSTVGGVSWIIAAESLSSTTDITRTHYVTALSYGSFGDQLALTSVVFTVGDSPRSLTFDYYLQRDGSQGGGQLAVYLLTLQLYPITRLFLSDDTVFNDWRSDGVCIPVNGTFRVMFQANVGYQFASDVRLTNVRLTKNSCNNSPQLEAMTGLTNCTFDARLCGGKLLSNSVNISSTWSTHDALTYIIGLFSPSTKYYYYYGEEGSISSPRYPAASGSGISAGYLFSGPGNSTVSLMFDYFKLALNQDFLKVLCERDEIRSLTGNWRPDEETLSYGCNYLKFETLRDDYSAFSLRYKVNFPPTFHATRYLLFRTTFEQSAAREAQLYFPPTTIDGPSCLSLTTTIITAALTVQLVYFSVESQRIVEVVLYRAVPTTAAFKDSPDARIISRTTIIPSLVEHQPFVVRITVSNSSIAIGLTDIRLLSTACIKPVDELLMMSESSLSLKLRFDCDSVFPDSNCPGFRDTSQDYYSWTSLLNNEIVCQFDPSFYKLDESASLTSAPINISSTSPEDSVLSIQVQYDYHGSQSAILQLSVRYTNTTVIYESVLPSNGKLFTHKTDVITSPFVIVLVAYRGQFNQMVTTLSFHMVHLMISNKVDMETGTECGNCGYTWGRQWRYYDTIGFVHSANGLFDVRENQLTFPEITVTESVLAEIGLATPLYRARRQIYVYVANKLGLINARQQLYANSTLQMSEDDRILTFCLPTGTYRLALILLSSSTDSISIYYRDSQRFMRITNMSCVASQPNKMTTDGVSKGTFFVPSLSDVRWICRNQLPVTFDGDVRVEVRYDSRGIFNLTSQRGPTQQAYREYWAYIIAAPRSALHVQADNASCVSQMFITTQGADGDFRKQLVTSENASYFIVESNNGIYQIIIAGKDLLTDETIGLKPCLKSISYEVTSPTCDVTTRNVAQCAPGELWCSGECKQESWTCDSDTGCVQPSDELHCEMYRALYTSQDFSTKPGAVVAEWMSEMMSVDNTTDNATVTMCIQTDTTLYNITSFMSVDVHYQTPHSNATNIAKVLNMSRDGSTLEPSNDVQFTLNDVLHYQVVIAFGVPQMLAGQIAAVVFSFTVFSTTCQKETGPGLNVSAEIPGGRFHDLVDESVGNVRWETRVKLPDNFTASNDPYNGILSMTISGRTCQRWDSQFPHLHQYMNMSDQQNYCRNPNYDTAPWCYTTDPEQRREYCLENIANNWIPYQTVQFADSLGTAILRLPSLQFDTVEGSECCLTFWYNITSPSIKVTVKNATTDLAIIKYSKQLASTQFKEPSGVNIPAHGLVTIYFVAEKFAMTYNDTINPAVYVGNFSTTRKRCLHDLAVSSESAPPPTPVVSNIAAKEQYIALKYNSTQDNIRTIVSQLGRQQQQFILRCSYEAQNCSGDAFQTIFTDYGLCYTFNNESSNQLTSTSAGVDSGLHLTLNIAQYDNVKWFSERVGLMIALHEPGDVVNMADQGIAVAPGLWSLFGLSYTQSTSLPPPCVKASEQKLHNISGPYTMEKCRRENAARKLYKRCSCITADMPDMYKVCSLEQYMTCVLKVQAQNDSCTDCVECPPTCENIDYDPMFSISQLSDIEVDSDTKEQFRLAMEKNNRVDSTILSSLLTSLVQLLSVERSLSDVIGVNIVDSRTSVTEQLLDSITTIVRVTQNCISAATKATANRSMPTNDAAMTNFQTWLQNRPALTAALPLTAVDRGYIVQTLTAEIEWLRLRIEQFNNETLKTAQLSNQFTAHKSILTSVVRNVSDLVLKDVDGELRTVANNYKQKISEFLNALMDQLGKLWSAGACDKNRNETELCIAINKLARGLFIWRKSIPPFRPTTDLNYAVQADNVTSVWPTSVNIPTYLRRMSGTNIKLNVDGFFEQLWPRLADVQNDINKLVSTAQSLVDVNITVTLSKVSSTLETGSDFISKNYVKVNVFYRELKTNVQEQQTTYSLVQLFSEMGGNLGLFVGGGALTAFELADVVLYNLYLKARRKRRTDKQQPQPSTLTAESSA